MPTPSFKLAPLPVLVCAIWAHAAVAAAERPVLLPAEIRPVDIQSSWGTQMATRRVLSHGEEATLAVARPSLTSPDAKPSAFIGANTPEGQSAEDSVATAASAKPKNALAETGPAMVANVERGGTTKPVKADGRPLLPTPAPSSTTAAIAAPPDNSGRIKARLAIDRGPRPSARPEMAPGAILPSNNRSRPRFNAGSVAATITRESTVVMGPSRLAPEAYPGLNTRSPLPAPEMSASSVGEFNNLRPREERSTRNATATVSAPSAATARTTLLASAVATTALVAAETAKPGSSTTHASPTSQDSVAPSAASAPVGSASRSARNESKMEATPRNAEAPSPNAPAISDRATMLASAATTSAMAATGSASTREKDAAELPVKSSIAPKPSAASVASVTPLRPVRSLLEMRRENVIMQEWDLSCGAAALATLLRYQHGDFVTEKEVAVTMMNRPEYLQRPDLIQIREGFSLLDLKRYADSRGFLGVATGKMELKDLIARAPIMVPINVLGYNHFVIFRGLRQNRVLLADPAWGNRTMLVNEFVDAWIDFPNIGHVGFVVKPRPNVDPASNLLAPRDIDFLTFG